MFKIIYFFGILAVVTAGGGYGGSNNGGGGYAGGASSGGGYGGSNAGLGGAQGGNPGLVSGFGGGPVTAAVQSSHTVEIRHVNVPVETPQPQIVEVEAGNLPLTIHFKSASSALNVVQTHQPSGAVEPQHTSSEDEPHRLVHEVRKPVIQELREIITPYRRVVQEILPVQEEIQTIIAKGESRQQAGAADIGGGIGGSVGGGFASSNGAGNGFTSSAGAGFASSGSGRSSGAGGYGGGLKSGGSYASAASNQASITSSSKASKSSVSATSALNYLDANSNGIQFSSSAVSSPSSSSGSKSASYNNESPIRIIEGGNSRSSGLSNINAYARRARA